jgi:hypothetical protein
VNRIDSFALATGQVSICGNPYHGLVMADGTLDTGVADPGVLTGLLAGPDTHVLAVPGTPAISRSVDQAAADAVHGQEWRASALIGRASERISLDDNENLQYGGYQLIYGKVMAISPSSWIYADSAGNRWTLRLAAPSGGATDWLFTGHLAPRLYARPFGRFNENAVDETELDAPTQLTFPSDGGAVVMYPHSYESPIEAYGDFNLSASAYVLRVLDVRAGGSKVLLGCVVTFIDSGANFRWIRSLVEATVTGAGDMDPGSLGDGIEVGFSLLDDVTDCETHSRNWEIDYLDEYNAAQHYSGDDPSIDPGWVGVTYMEADFQAGRLIAAWYDSNGDIIRRWMRYTRHGEHTFTGGGALYEADRLEVETLQYLEDASVTSTLSLQVDYHVEGDDRTAPTYFDGTETLRLTDYYEAGDDPARSWTYDSTENPAWVQVEENHDEWADWVTEFHNAAGLFLPPVNTQQYPENMLQPIIGWGPMVEVFLFGHKKMTWGTGAGSMFLHIHEQTYSSSLINGWSILRASQTWYAAGGYYDQIAEGWILQDLCTPVENIEDASRKTTTEKSVNLGRIDVENLLNPILSAAYDRHTSDTAWGTEGDNVSGYV